VPKSTVKIEFGEIDKKGHFQPWKANGWAKLTPGLQPGFHIWAAVRMTIDGHPASTDKLKAKTIVDITVWDGCTFAGLNFTKIIYPKPSGAAYVYGDKVVAGIQLRFKKPTGHDLPKDQLWEKCGEWVDIRADFYNTATKAFGRKWFRMRTYAEQPADYAACK